MSAARRWPRISHRRNRLQRLRKNVADRSRGLVDPKQRRPGGGKIYRADPPAIDARSKGRAIKAERNVAIIGPRTEVRRAAAGQAFHLIARKDRHYVPAAIGRIAVGKKPAKLAVRISPSG